MEIILDLPYDFYNYIDQHTVFMLAQHVKWLNQEKPTLLRYLTGNHQVMLDNGAWPGDGGKTMDPGQYLSVVKDIRPDIVVVPDVLGDAEKTMDIASKFLEIADDDNCILMCPLQGKTVTENINMAYWWKTEMESKPFIFGVPKGTIPMMLPPRAETIRAVTAIIPWAKFHLLGYRFGRPDYSQVISIDTKKPVKECFTGWTEYYQQEWNRLNDMVHERIRYSIRMFERAMRSDDNGTF